MKYLHTKRNQDGFTLIEILMSTLLIAILMSVIIAAVDPTTRMEDSRNVQRWEDVNIISTSIFGYTVDYQGLPEEIGFKERQLGTSKTGCSDNCPSAEDECLDLSEVLNQYIPSMPHDPNASSEKTGYSIIRNKQGVITVRSCMAENDMKVSVSR